MAASGFHFSSPGVTLYMKGGDQGEKGKAGTESRDGSGNEQIITICMANASLEMTRTRKFTKRFTIFRIYFLYLKGSETKHLSAPGFVLWQKTLFQLSSHKQDCKTRSKAPIAFKRLQDVIMIFWHLAFQRGVFTVMTQTHACVKGES